MGCRSSTQRHPSYDQIVIPKISQSDLTKVTGKHIFVLKRKSNSTSLFSSISNKSGHSVYICFLEEDASYHKTCLYDYEIVNSKFIKIPSGRKWIFGKWQFSHFQEGDYEATCEKAFSDDNFVIYKGRPKSENNH
jgi:hypothetical protein